MIILSPGKEHHCHRGPREAERGIPLVAAGHLPAGAGGPRLRGDRAAGLLPLPLPGRVRAMQHIYKYLQISTNIYTQLYLQVPGGGRELLQPGEGGPGGGGHPAPLHPGRGHDGGGGGGRGGVRGGSTPWTLLGTALPCDHLHATVRSATMNKYLSHRLVFVFLPPSLLCHIVMTP